MSGWYENMSTILIKGPKRQLDARSRQLRRIAIQILEMAGRGHLGSTFSLLEVIRVLYDEVLRYDPKNPRWPGRDRCILSKGHGCIALYVLLSDKGFFPEGELWNFCRSDGILGGHPEASKVPGVEASTGALGHGLSIGVGIALAGRHDGTGYRVFVITGDGELNEGSIWEAAMGAAKHRLSNLTVIVDYNKYQSYGPTKEILDLEPLADKWRSFGFAVREADGHNVEELHSVFSSVPLDPDRPSAIICHTVKGKGVSFAENNPAWHHKNRLTREELEALYREIEAS